MVQKIAKLHNASIQVDSKLNEGTSFLIEFKNEEKF